MVLLICDTVLDAIDKQNQKHSQSVDCVRTRVDFGHRHLLVMMLANNLLTIQEGEYRLV